MPLIVLRNLGRKQVPGYRPRPDLEALALPSLHGVGLLLGSSVGVMGTIYPSLTVSRQTAPPKGQPRIVSRLLTLEYESKICKQVCFSIFYQSLRRVHEY